MHMYVYTYMYICVCMHVHTCMYLYMHIYVLYIYIYIHMHLWFQISIKGLGMQCLYIEEDHCIFQKYGKCVLSFWLLTSFMCLVISMYSDGDTKKSLLYEQYTVDYLLMPLHSLCNHAFLYSK